MTYDPGLAQSLRDALTGLPFTEKKMFGGLCFLLNGHMAAGVHSGGAMVRVGKENYGAALALPGVAPMLFTGRPMAGMVDVRGTVVADEAVLGLLISMALATVRALPPKVAKPKKG